MTPSLFHDILSYIYESILLHSRWPIFGHLFRAVSNRESALRLLGHAARNQYEGVQCSLTDRFFSIFKARGTCEWPVQGRAAADIIFVVSIIAKMALWESKSRER